MCRQLTRHLDLADISSSPSRAGAAPSPAFTAPCSGVTQVHLPPWNQKQQQGVSGWLDTKWTLIICARRHARVHILLLKQEQECSFLKTSGSLHTSSTPNHFFNCERKKATYNPGSLKKTQQKTKNRTSVYNHQVNHQNTCERVAEWRKHWCKKDPWTKKKIKGCHLKRKETLDLNHTALHRCGEENNIAAAQQKQQNATTYRSRAPSGPAPSSSAAAHQLTISEHHSWDVNRGVGTPYCASAPQNRLRW